MFCIKVLLQKTKVGKVKNLKKNQIIRNNQQLQYLQYQTNQNPNDRDYCKREHFFYYLVKDKMKEGQNERKLR